MAEHRCEAAVAPVSDLMEKAEYFPMGTLHEDSEEAVGIRVNYEKRDKGSIPACAGYSPITPPGNAVWGFYEDSQVLPFPGRPRK